MLPGKIVGLGYCNSICVNVGLSKNTAEFSVGGQTDFRGSHCHACHLAGSASALSQLTNFSNFLPCTAASLTLVCMSWLY